MVLPSLLFAAFALLATLGLFLLLRHHFGLRVALLWSSLLVLGFVALGAWIVWLVESFEPNLPVSLP